VLVAICELAGRELKLVLRAEAGAQILVDFAEFTRVVRSVELTACQIRKGLQDVRFDVGSKPNERQRNVVRYRGIDQRVEANFAARVLAVGKHNHHPRSLLSDE
jgi:hypothetical protein